MKYVAVALITAMVTAGSVTAGPRLLTGKDIKKGSITGRDIKDKSLTIRDIRPWKTKDTASTAPAVKGDQGPQGPPGPTGSSGPPGPSGPSGTANVSTVTADASVPALSDVARTTQCPAGQRMLGGGFEVLGIQGMNVDMRRSVPDGNGWTVEITSTAMNDGTLRVHVLCAS